MPSIVINELDNTSPGTIATINDVVFVPGFVNKQYLSREGIADPFMPQLCTSVTDFERYFGEVPAQFEIQGSTEAGTIDSWKFPSGVFPVWATPEEDTFSKNSMDPGYVYAKELLVAGLPVYYVRINETENDITVSDMYEALNDAKNLKVWANLYDKDEYPEIKYLTTGGYPNFEYCKSTTTNYTPYDVDVASFNENRFLSIIPEGYRTSDFEFITTYYPEYEKVTSDYMFNTEVDLKQLEPSEHKDKYAYAKDTDLVYVATKRDKTDTREYSGKYSTKEEIDALAKAENKDKVYLLASFKIATAKYTYSAYYIKETLVEGSDPTYSAEQTDLLYIWNNYATKVWCWDLYKDDVIVYHKDTEDINNMGFTLNVVSGQPVMLKAGAKIHVDYTVLSSASSVIVNKMLALAATRGDCIAFVDHTNKPSRKVDPNNATSVYYSISNIKSSYRIVSNGTYGAMYTPWGGISLSSSLYDKSNKNAIAPSYMPGSYIYLQALAISNKSNPNWLAIAGGIRGAAPITSLCVSSTQRLSSSIADAYQPRNGIAINPIANIKPFGYTIWGNRTLFDNTDNGNTTASSFANVRNMVSDIKKVVYNAAKRCMFEHNSDILWINFMSMITPHLDNLSAGSGISNYNIEKVATTEKAKLVCKITIVPMYAIEDFDITIIMTDDEVTVS